MRKKKKEIAPAPVETDFYTEALKAFDVVLPPTQEELEAQRLAQEKQARKRVWRLRAAILAVVAVTVALLLWRPWETPITDMPYVSVPPGGVAAMFDTKLTFHVYTVPGSYGVSMVPAGGTVELTKEQMDSLLERLEALKWSPTALLSSIPPAPIGDFTFTREGQQHQVSFNGYGTIYADGYMAKPDTALWNDLFTLLQQQSGQPPIGRFGTELVDGSVLFLDIQSDGSFVVLKDQGIEFSGYWGMVANYLLLYTSEPRVGFAILRTGNDGGMAYLETHDLWLLKELKGQQPLYPADAATQKVASMMVELSMPGSGAERFGTAQLTKQQRDQYIQLLENIPWSSGLVTNTSPQWCGKVSVSERVSDSATRTVSIRFTHTGLITDGNRFALLEDVQWMEFVQLLSEVNSRDLLFRRYSPDQDAGQILLSFMEEGRFEYWDVTDDTTGAVMGFYLQVGDTVLLAGPDGLRELLFWERDSGDLITQSGEVLEQIPILYGIA